MEEQKSLARSFARAQTRRSQTGCQCLAQIRSNIWYLPLRRTSRCEPDTKYERDVYGWRADPPSVDASEQADELSSGLRVASRRHCRF
jgi:hypothetical protein